MLKKKKERKKEISFEGTSLAVQWLRLCLTGKGVLVRSLVEELRAKIPHASRPKNIKEKQYCNKFNKDCKKKKEIPFGGNTLMLHF